MPSDAPPKRHKRRARVGQIPWLLVAEVLLASAIFFTPLALGSVYAWSIGVMLALSTSAAVAGALASGRSRRVDESTRLDLSKGSGQRPPLARQVNWRASPHPWSLTASALVAVAAFTALQCLPLPGALLKLLSPETARLYAFSLAGLPGEHAAHPLSLDPAATGREFAKALAYAAAFVATLALGASRSTRRRLAFALSLSGFAVAAIGYAHKLLGLDQLFGAALYSSATPRFVTTFGDSNNAAGLFILCAPLALAFALRTSNWTARALWGSVYAFTGAAVFLTLSRGGAAAFLFSQLAFAGLWAWQRQRAATGALGPRAAAAARGQIVAVLVALAGVLAMAAYLALGPLLDRASTLRDPNSDQKLTGFVQSLPLLRDYPLFGIGRGAFATVGARYLTFARETAEYVEDEPLQTVIDFGLPFGLALLGWFLFQLGRAGLRLQTSPLACGLWAGLFGLGLANTVDFSLELGGVALPATVAFALLLSEDSAERGRVVPARAVLAALAFSVPLAFWALARSDPDWRTETNQFAALAPRWKGAAAASAADPVLRRHPASFVVPLAVAGSYLGEHAPARALSWLNRAMYLKPNLELTHLEAAAALAQLGHPAQALLEARTYDELTHGNTQALAVVAHYLPRTQSLLAGVPDTAGGLLSLAEFLAQRGQIDSALEAAAQGVARDPADPALLRRHVALLLSAKRLPEALAEAQKAVALAPTDPAGYRALANVQIAAGTPAPARQTLEEGLRRHPGDDDLVFALVQLDLAQTQLSLAELDLKKLGPQDSSAARARVFALQADILVREGRTVKAEEAYRNAIRVQPNAGHEWALAALLEQQSNFEGAIELLRELRAATPEEQQAPIDQRINQDQQRQGAFDQATRTQLLLGKP